MEQKPNKNNTQGLILGLEMDVSNLQDDLDHLTLDCELFRAKLREMNKAMVHIRGEAKIISIREFRRLVYDIKATDQQIISLQVGISTVTDKMENKLKAIEYYTMLYEQEQEYLARKVLPFVRKSDDVKN